MFKRQFHVRKEKTEVEAEEKGTSKFFKKPGYKDDRIWGLG